MRVSGQLTFLAVPRLSRALARCRRGATSSSSWTARSWTMRRTRRCRTGRPPTGRTAAAVTLGGRPGSRSPSPAERALPAGPGRPGATTTAPGPARDRAADPESSGSQLLGGVSAFQRNTAPLVREELARLAREGQRPSQLFLTCADSRLVTSMITSSGPGDLFTVRNVGNLVPPPGAESRLTTRWRAAIEYAVEVLRGRLASRCAGTPAAARCRRCSAPRPDDAEPTPLGAGCGTAGRAWSGCSRHRTAGPRSRRPAGRRPTTSEQLCLTNVVQQLDHLRAHECGGASGWPRARSSCTGCTSMSARPRRIVLRAPRPARSTRSSTASAGTRRADRRRRDPVAALEPCDVRPARQPPPGSGLRSQPHRRLQV